MPISLTVFETFGPKHVNEHIHTHADTPTNERTNNYTTDRNTSWRIGVMIIAHYTTHFNTRFVANHMECTLQTSPVAVFCASLMYLHCAWNLSWVDLSAGAWTPWPSPAAAVTSDNWLTRPVGCLVETVCNLRLSEHSPALTHTHTNIRGLYKHFHHYVVHLRPKRVVTDKTTKQHKFVGLSRLRHSHLYPR